MPLEVGQLKEDLRGILGDFAQTVTFRRGARQFSVACAADAFGASGSVADGAAGFDADDSQTVCVYSGDCAFPLKRGDTALVDGIRYRVASVRRVPGDVCLFVTLEGGR